MKSERYLIKNLTKRITKLFVLPVTLMFGLTFIMGFYYERNIYTKLNDITLELGEKLPEEITKYMTIIGDKSNLTIESNVPLTEDGNTKIIGKFTYYLAYNDVNYKYSVLTNAKSTITVIDTVKPEIIVKEDVKIKYNGTINPSDVAECYDLSDCKMYIKEDIDTTKSGEYEVNIVATDGANNKSYAKTKITVLEKPKPVVYSFNPNAGKTFAAMENQNSEKNATLSDEEKNNLRYAVAEFAKQFVGNPYVYGGTSLTNGADCSGFTLSIYANYGYALPRSALDQAYIGSPVSADSLLPGDLVVYYGHVGIYVGDGMMVHASTPEGGIKYAPMYDGYRVYRRIIV